MWNKGLSYRERHGLGHAGMNKVINTNVDDTLHTDTNASKHSLGLVFSLPLTGRFLKLIQNDKSDCCIRVIKSLRKAY